jgi:hypothetical protein
VCHTGVDSLFSAATSLEYAAGEGVLQRPNEERIFSHFNGVYFTL